MVTGALGAFVVAWKVASEVRSFFFCHVMTVMRLLEA